MSSSSNTRPSGRAKSCVVCRQFKLACDARKTNPNPCSRCVSKNLVCRFDPNFKRISTRRITQEVATELHELRAVYRADAPQGNTQHSQLVLSGQSPASHAGNQSVSSHDSTEQSFGTGTEWFQLNEDEVVLDQSLHGITVSSTRILKLFYHFGRYYYPHARFLAPVKSINRLAQRSPLLLCTILLVASERYEGHNELYEQLYFAHDVLVAEILHISIQKLEVVHALMILCLWPVPKLRNAYDPGWNYIGLAIQAAISLNCHRPLEAGHPIAHYKGPSDTLAADMDPKNQAMTWLYCYTIGCRLGAYHGCPPPICSPQYGKSIKRARSLAAELLTQDEKAQIDMLDVFSDAQIHLETMEDANAQYSMLEAYISRLDMIKSSFNEQWSWHLEITYQGLNLYILGIALLPDISYDDQQATSYRQLILQKCLNAASSCILTLTNMSFQPASGSRYPSGILTFYPKHHFTTLMAAASYIFRFLIDSRNVNQQQQSLCLTRLTEAHKIFQSFPDHRDAVRGCITIEMIVGYLRSSTRGNSNILVKHRLGASVVLDASFRAAQNRNMHMIDGSTPPVANWTSMNDIDAYRLPLAPEQKVASPRDLQQQQQQQEPSQQSWQANDIALGIWDTYANDFAVLNEPWIGTDAEFASIMAMSGPSTDIPTGSTFSESANV